MGEETIQMTPERAEELGRRFGEGAGAVIAEQVRAVLSGMATPVREQEWRGGTPTADQVKQFTGQAQQADGAGTQQDLLRQVLAAMDDLRASVDQVVQALTDGSGG